jgi:hypothetical protein
MQDFNSAMTPEMTQYAALNSTLGQAPQAGTRRKLSQEEAFIALGGNTEVAPSPRLQEAGTGVTRLSQSDSEYAPSVSSNSDDSTKLVNLYVTSEGHKGKFEGYKQGQSDQLKNGAITGASIGTLIGGGIGSGFTKSAAGWAIGATIGGTIFAAIGSIWGAFTGGDAAVKGATEQAQARAYLKLNKEGIDKAAFNVDAPPAKN